MPDSAAILTTTQREYLEGENPVDRPSHERELRTRLRNRVRNGVADFSILLECLPAKDRELIFRGQRGPSKGDDFNQQFSGEREILDGEVEPGVPHRFFSPDEDILKRTNSELEQGMIDAIAFFYTAAQDAGVNPQSLIESGVERAEERMNDDRWIINDVSLEVDKGVQHKLAKDALKSMKAGDELTNAELRALLESGRGNVTAEQIQKYVAGEWEPDDSEMLDPASGV